ncbi:unnamed protein product [Malus baccata var. baccata]
MKILHHLQYILKLLNETRENQSHVGQLFPFAHPHRPLNFNQINSAVNHNYHHIRIRREKITLSPSPRLAALWNSSSPFCTAADASAVASASASEVVSDAAVVDKAVPVSEFVHEQKKKKDAADLLDIRVGRVLKAWRHEEADSLYVEEVDVGEAESRIICSGLVRYIPLDHLQDRNVVVLANLKLRNMCGVKSNGMLMAASDASHENVELLLPPEGSLPGERVWFGSKDDHLNQPPAASPNQVSARLFKQELGMAVHAHIAKNSFHHDRFISVSLIHMYATCQDIVYASKVFDGIPVRNSVSWNSMLDGYAKCGDVISAREVFKLMPECNVVSWSSLIDRHWDDVRSLREAMERRGVKKSPGWINELFYDGFLAFQNFIQTNVHIQKKKIWELVQPHMKTDNSCIALLGEHVMRTSAGVRIMNVIALGPPYGL